MLPAVYGVAGFFVVFGVAHLLLVEITKPSGYLFFGLVAAVPLVVAAALLAVTADRPAALKRLGFGALMCLCAIPTIYLARFAPEASRQTVRNLLGVPFLILAVTGPGIFTRRRSR